MKCKVRNKSIPKIILIVIFVLLFSYVQAAAEDEPVALQLEQKVTFSLGNAGLGLFRSKVHKCALTFFRNDNGNQAELINQKTLSSKWKVNLPWEHSGCLNTVVFMPSCVIIGSVVEYGEAEMAFICRLSIDKGEISWFQKLQVQKAQNLPSWCPHQQAKTLEFSKDITFLPEFVFSRRGQKSIRVLDLTSGSINRTYKNPEVTDRARFAEFVTDENHLFAFLFPFESTEEIVARRGKDSAHVRVLCLDLKDIEVKWARETPIKVGIVGHHSPDTLENRVNVKAVCGYGIIAARSFTNNASGAFCCYSTADGMVPRSSNLSGMALFGCRTIRDRYVYADYSHPESKTFEGYDFSNGDMFRISTPTSPEAFGRLIDTSPMEGKFCVVYLNYLFEFDMKSRITGLWRIPHHEDLFFDESGVLWVIDRRFLIAYKLTR